MWRAELRRLERFLDRRQLRFDQRTAVAAHRLEIDMAMRASIAEIIGCAPFSATIGAA